MKEKRGTKKFNKKQLEAIRNSPMFVKKRAAAAAMFASPEYKEFEKKFKKENK